MLPQDVAELLRATTSDADAVAQYLVSIDRDELNGLLDRFAAHETKKKHEQQRGDWLALVQLLLRSESARLRTATRIIQLVWNGSSSELEGMQWLTEISLSYLGVLEDDSSNSTGGAGGGNKSVTRHAGGDTSLTRRVHLAAIADEVRLLLRVLSELLRDGIETYGSANPRRALPQMLALLPILLGVLGELAAVSGDAATSDEELHEHLVALLELPWTTKTVPLLLDVLKESASIVSASGWTQLQKNMERMVTGTDELPSESMNAIIRECVALGSVTGNCHWLSIARHVFRKLPPRLRQEAEFNLQMCLHQSHAAVTLVCESIRLSLEHESSSSGADPHEHDHELPGGALRLALDWRDLVFLFHALQVSRPILHHRTASSRIATDASVFAEIEQLTWAILRLDLARAHCTAVEAVVVSAPPSADLTKCLTERVAQLLTFGGKQVHVREWKALLLMDFALFWLETDSPRTRRDVVTGLSEHETQLFAHTASAFPNSDAFARMLLLAVFQTAPEVRAEMLSSLFEGTKSPERVQVAGKALDQLFRSQRATLFPHLNAIQDWLNVLFQSHFGSARAFFLMTSQLMPVLKDLYSFLMVFLRKLLSVANVEHQRFAIDLWCSWLEHGLHFDALQEEEVVSALINSLRVCQSLRAWTLARLEQMLQPGTTVLLRRSSWEELHRLLAGEVAQFIQPAATITLVGASNGRLGDDFHGDDDDDDDGDDDNDDECSLSQYQRFQVGALDQFYRQDTSADGAAAVGLVCQRALSCLLSFEAAAAVATDSELALPAIGTELLRWTRDFVANSELFFHWVSCTSSDDDDANDGDDGEWLVALREPTGSASARRQQPLPPSSGATALAKKAMWRLLSRIGIGSALCSVAIEQLLLQWQRHRESSSAGSVGGTTASMWPLVEVQLCLHRLLRKLVALHGAAVELKHPKAYLAASVGGVASVVDAHSAQILADVSARLACGSSPASSASGASTSSAHDSDSVGETHAGDLSFDSLLFVLDSCSSSGRSAVSPAPAHTFRQRASAERVRVLHALLQLYAAVSAQAFADATLTAADAGAAAYARDHRAVFTVYAESLTAKFPKALRHLVAVPKTAKHVVLLDARAAEDVLVRVFAAIGRVLDTVLDTVGVAAADAQVHAMLTADAVFAPALARSGSGGGGFVALAAVLLQDVGTIVAQRELSKLKVLSAALAKRLCDLGADVASSSSCSRRDARAFAATMRRFSAAVYDILCEHVVYHAPLLRALLGIGLSVHLGRELRSVVQFAGRIEGVLLACGFDVALLSATRSRAARHTNGASHAAATAVMSPGPLDSSDSDEVPATPSKRRRLRQLAASTAAAVTVTTTMSMSPPQDASKSDAESDTHACFAQPHLASSDAQCAALQALLALLDASQSSLHRQLSSPRVHSADASSAPLRLATVLQYVALCERALHALLTSKDASWVTAKVLLKLLSATEWCLRIAKTCIGSSALKRVRGASDASSDWRSACVDILESTVRTAIQARVWVNALKESVRETVTKTRLSATALKVDVFLSDVPQLVASFAKETHLSDALLERIRAVLALVASHMAPAVASVAGGGKSGNSSANVLARRNMHMLGVVPIVKKRKRRLRSRHPYIDDWLRDEDGSDAYADLEDFIE